MQRWRINNYSGSMNSIKQRAITAKFYSVESGINTYQTLFQPNFCQQPSVQPQWGQIGLQSQTITFDPFMYTSIINIVMFLIIISLKKTASDDIGKPNM